MLIKGGGLLQERAKLALPFQKAHLGFPRVPPPIGPASSALSGKTSSDSLQTTYHLGPACTPMEGLMDGLTLPHQALQGEEDARHLLTRLRPSPS